MFFSILNRFTAVAVFTAKLTSALNPAKNCHHHRIIITAVLFQATGPIAIKSTKKQ